MWSLLRLWHLEAPEAVIGQPDAIMFVRTSYVTSPERWRELPATELRGCLEILLNAACRSRAGADDATPMRCFAFLYEWVERADVPADPAAVSHPWFLPKAKAHPNLIERAYVELDAKLQAARKGIASKAYEDAFQVFRIDDDDRGHLIQDDRAGVLASRHA